MSLFHTVDPKFSHNLSTKRKSIEIVNSACNELHVYRLIHYTQIPFIILDIFVNKNF